MPWPFPPGQFVLVTFQARQKWALKRAGMLKRKRFKVFCCVLALPFLSDQFVALAGGVHFFCRRSSPSSEVNKFVKKCSRSAFEF